MKTLTLVAALTALATAPNAANAQGWLDTINNVVNKVDETMSTVDRVENTAGKVMDKVPEGQQPETVEPAAGNGAPKPLTAQEKMIIKKAHTTNDPELQAMADAILARFE